MFDSNTGYTLLTKRVVKSRIERCLHPWKMYTLLNACDGVVWTISRIEEPVLPYVSTSTTQSYTTHSDFMRHDCAACSGLTGAICESYTTCARVVYVFIKSRIRPLFIFLYIM